MTVSTRRRPQLDRGGSTYDSQGTTLLLRDYKEGATENATDVSKTIQVGHQLTDEMQGAKLHLFPASVKPGGRPQYVSTASMILSQSGQTTVVEGTDAFS